MSVRLGLILLLTISAAAQTISSSTFAGLHYRSIGPAATGGRIADIAVSKTPGRTDEVYVATTAGGIFKSGNGGVSWNPIFDHAGGMMSIGAVAVSTSNPQIVWAGTGEVDNRQSSSWGDGVYKSSDGGVTWQKMGLDDTRHIGRIVIHPTDPNVVYIAAAGHLWGSNSERGVYKTTDGGKSWKRVLYKDENTGAIDVAMDPGDPGVLYAAMYQHQRKGWGYNGGGPGSGLYKTADGGATWTELKNGLPAGDRGRIGLTVFPGDPKIVYAIVEADRIGFRRGDEGGADSGGRGRNAAARGGVFRSSDAGETWEHVSTLNPRPSYYSRIYVDPKDSSRVYIMGSNRGFYISNDSGHTFQDVFSNVHGEDHALWIDPENTNHLIIGGDGGISISYDRGQSWLFRLNLPIGQFYNISVNNQDPFLVCGGLQDNGSWCTPTATNVGYGVSFKEAFNIGGGDGMQAIFDGDDRTVLVSSQNGVTSRLDLPSMQRQSIGPVPPPERVQPGDAPYRWYWTTPLIVSSFNPATIYTGANMLFRSEDRGASWKAISPDLTAHVDRDKLAMMGAPVTASAFSRHDGQSNFSALTVIAESPMNRNVLYTGADDGTVQMTRDGGAHWTNLTANLQGLPHGLNISGIAPSNAAAGRVYLTVDGHFDDDYHAYVFVSEDFGATWRAITAGLPATSVHRIREYPANANLLVAGTEMGVYASFDRGTNWVSLNLNMPPVPVYDLVFQEKQNALVLGTHGRSIWVLDHVEAIEQMTPAIVSGGGHLFPIPAVHHEVVYPGQFWFGAGEFFAPNPPSGAVLTYYLSKASSEVRITIAGPDGKIVRNMRGPAGTGINRTCWDLRMDPALGTLPQMGTCLPAAGGGFGGSRGLGPLVAAGKYKVSVSADGGPLMPATATVESDPRFPMTDKDRQTRQTALMKSYHLQQELAVARDAALRMSNAVDVQSQISRALAAAANVQAAIDGYAGLPSGTQLQQLEWAAEDAKAALAALDKLRVSSRPEPR